MPCLGDGGALAFAFVVKWMSMLEAEVSMAVFTYHFHELFLPTARLPTFISEYLALLLSRVRLAVTINVFPDNEVWSLAPFYRNWVVTQGANWNLHILLVSRAAVMEDVRHVVFAENLLTGVTFKR